MRKGNLIALIGFTGFSQLIYIICLPIITEYSSSKVFAYYGQYIAIMTLLTIFITLRDEMYFFYVDEKERKDIQKNLERRTLIYFFIAIFLFILQMRNALPSYLDVYILGILGASFNSLINVKIQESVLNGKYYRISLLRNGWVLLSPVLSVLYYGLGGGDVFFIIYSDIISRFILIIPFIRKLNFKNNRLYKTERNIRFRKIDLMNALSSVFLYNQPFLILPYFIQGDILGYIFIAFRIAMAPAALLSNPINDYFKGIHKCLEKEDDIRKLIKEITMISLVLSFMYIIGYFTIQIIEKIEIIESAIVVNVMIFMVPSLLRVMYASFNFIQYATNNVKLALKVFTASNIFLLICIALSVYTNANDYYITLNLAIGYSFAMALANITNINMLRNKC